MKNRKKSTTTVWKRYTVLYIECRKDKIENLIRRDWTYECGVYEICVSHSVFCFWHKNRKSHLYIPKIYFTLKFMSLESCTLSGILTDMFSILQLFFFHIWNLSLSKKWYAMKSTYSCCNDTRKYTRKWYISYLNHIK